VAADRKPAPAPAPTAGAAGSWGPVFNWPIIAIHLSVLPDKRVLSWTSNDHDHASSTPNVYVWDPARPTQAHVQVPNTSTDLFCSSHSFLPNGDLVVAGGHLEIDGGAKDGNIYRWNTGVAGTWTKTEPMRAGRWYPSSATLANGEMVVVGGNEENHALNLYPEVWTGTGWRLLAGAPLQMPWYPFVFAAPNGQMFLAGPDVMSRYLNASGTGAWTNVASSVRGALHAVRAERRGRAIGGGRRPDHRDEGAAAAAHAGRTQCARGPAAR
jgi:hypothetical protein